MKFLLFVNGLWRCGKMDPFDQGARISNGPFLLLNLVSKLCPMFYSCNLNIQIGVAKWGGALWCVTNLQCPAGCQEDWNILLREQISPRGKSEFKTYTHLGCHLKRLFWEVRTNIIKELLFIISTVRIQSEWDCSKLYVISGLSCSKEWLVPRRLKIVFSLSGFFLNHEKILRHNLPTFNERELY